ncbi:MAG: HIT domain-containing protein [Gammaproteobacteria bacterium]|nr:HIT domain-containing protein [Gammaproteobacteria bacterium]MCF6229446.1 HIT domain-containing protein [Gammaproteobacteria bacterium]
MFQLDPRLDNDCTVIGSFKLSLLLLMNDANYPWFILVPREADAREIYQLSDQQQQQLTCESCQLSKALAATFNSDKINIASLGNIVAQLHIHHVVRYRNDLSWPAPIWGRHKTLPYTAEEQRVVTQQLTHALDSHFVPTA